MPPSTPRLFVGKASLLVMIVLVPGDSLFRATAPWSAVGAAYALALLVAGAAWHRLDRPLEFVETVGIAVVVVVGGLPLAPRLFGGDLVPPPLLPSWLALQFYLLAFVPVAFVLPLGAATTWRQRLGVAAVVPLPALYRLFDWFVLHPERFGAATFGIVTPESLVWTTVGLFVFYTAAGGPLFELGRDLARGDGPLLDAARRLDATGAGRSTEGT